MPSPNQLFTLQGATPADVLNFVLAQESKNGVYTYYTDTQGEPARRAEMTIRTQILKNGNKKLDVRVMIPVTKLNAQNQIYRADWNRFSMSIEQSRFNNSSAVANLDQQICSMFTAGETATWVPLRNGGMLIR